MSWPESLTIVDYLQEADDTLNSSTRSKKIHTIK